MASSADVPERVTALVDAFEIETRRLAHSVGREQFKKALPVFQSARRALLAELAKAYAVVEAARREAARHDEEHGAADTGEGVLCELCTSLRALDAPTKETP